MKINQLTRFTLSLSTLFVLALFTFVPAARAQVAGMGAGTDIGLSATITGFTAPAGTNRVLIVTVSDALSTNILTASFNGTAMVEQAENTDGNAVDAIYTLSLGTSASSTTGDIVVTSGNAAVTGKYITARVYQNVHQTAPLTNIQSSNGVPSTTTFNVTSAVGDLAIDLLDTYNSTTGGTRTPGSGQTLVHSSSPIGISGGYAFYGITTKPGAASVSMAWTSDHEFFIHIAANIQQVAAPLPVTLVSFDAALSQNNVTLNWKISDAVNFSYFEIEKSGDGSNFKTIGKLAFSAADPTYNFIDNNVTGDQLYYRLKMTDLDGSFSYSKMVPVSLSKPNSIHLNSLQPNPFANVLNASVYMPQSAPVTFTLTDMAGTIVYSKQTILPKGSSTHPIEGLQQLKKGIYMLRIHRGREIISRKVVKQ